MTEKLQRPARVVYRPAPPGAGDGAGAHLSVNGIDLSMVVNRVEVESNGREHEVRLTFPACEVEWS